MWGNLGIARIARLNAGHTLVKFRDEATRDLVLENGILHFDRKPVVVRPWTTELDHLKLVKSVPVWVRLPGLSLQYWGSKCLSALVSTIGNPILVDKVTKDRSMMQFARVLVEIEIADEIPKAIQFLNERGQLMEQLIEFEWLPTQCKNCKVFGHTESLCTRKKVEIWKPKVQKLDGETVGQPSEVHTDSTCSVLVQDSDNTDQQGNGIQLTTSVQVQHDEKGVLIAHGSDSGQVTGENETEVLSVTKEKDWITPKKVGGGKRLATKAKSKLQNTYSVLQDKQVEGLKLVGSAGQKLNGELPNT
ncbi:uncharacterized protein LOC133779231 [Humulus lupulus]|uniref:uncharacterized protein LOC133779231 n=1 Tax=Humulus lupulus TaxID=3486 RepID=UPI002B400556|nr:uncharacterized protein LOC133779231 [Humulus lupulus]